MSSKLSLLWLQAFVAVAQQRVAAGRGSALRVLSHQHAVQGTLQKLEAPSWARRLFDHGKRPLALTANGHRFLQHAEAHVASAF